MLKNFPSKGRLEIAEIASSASPAQAFETIVGGDHPFFMDTGLPDCHGLGHFSFMSAGPFMIISGRGDTFEARLGSGEKISAADPLELTASAVRHFRVEGERGEIPFCGGAVGFFAYDLGRFIEKLPRNAVDDQNYPELYLAYYDRVLAFDHSSGKKYLCRTSFEGAKKTDIREEARRFAEQIDSGRRAAFGENSHTKAEAVAEPESNFTRDDYLEAVERALEYIRAGDIYQVNLSQRFSAPLAEHPWATYRRLRKLNTAPMGAYLGFNGIAALSSSPERFMKVTGRNVETRPIKGTRPRGSDPDEDARLKKELIGSAKDRAELNMIVDLERNDLGRVCEYGSVAVTRHAEVESYSTVHHLVSTVEGVLREGLDVCDLLKASFPGGSITGAPKIRSMEIIDELEPTARNLYTGSIGYIGFDRNADLNIAIRTLLAGPDRISFQVGGGIVADSDPEQEYNETLVKGLAIFQTLNAPINGA